jgi:hypothetical protein
VVSTLEFVAQLECPTDEIFEAERSALRKQAPGPGNWIACEDLENLTCFGIGASFRTIWATAKAAKLRIFHDLGSREMKKKAELIRTAQMHSLRRPFGVWHARSYAKMLCDNYDQLRQKGIEMDSSGDNFQKHARAEIQRRLAAYDLEERIRTKVKRWKFQDPARHVAVRLIDNFKVFQKRLSPATRATYLRALWNGIPTSRRMATCKDFNVVGCVFACTAHAEDSLEHYCRCPKLRPAFNKVGARPVECLDDFFGTWRGLDEDAKVDVARRVRATCRAAQLARKGGYDTCEELVNIEWNKTFGST